jgi:tRNA (guanine-N7-)-methyltransferase
MNADHSPREPRAFFGRRKGHNLRDKPATLMETLLPQLALPISERAPDDLAALFPIPVREVRMEIGFGGGEHLIAQAQQNPEIGYIGVEPFINGMAKALTAIDAQGLRNIRLHFGDAVVLFDWLPAAALTRIDLLYPDPWPKRRHWKRRFVQDDSLRSLARLLRSGGEFRFATDIPHYAAWTLARIMRSADFEWTAECAADWHSPWPGFVRTRYEAKAIREGRTPAYFIFQRR